MSEENLEIVRQVFELFRNREATAESGFGEADLARALELFHLDFELDATRAPMTDLQGVYRGTDAIEFWRRWLEAWDIVEIEYELTDADDRVLAEMTQRMRGKGSGIEVDFPQHWQVFTLSEGRIARHAFYLDEAEAREAAGLSE
jgi:ketosteroid isomerase-like protein